MSTLFQKEYDGESIVDLTRDIDEAFMLDFNPAMKDVPQDSHGFWTGTFKVTVEWEPA